MRLQALEFLIQSARKLEVLPIVKYSALALFADRFYPSFSRFTNGNDTRHWLLEPIRESSLQLFSIVSIWISSKIHDSPPVSVKSLKSLGDKMIKEQHFTTRDFLEAEVVFMQVLNFEIGTSDIAYTFLEELLAQFREVVRVGELVKFEACMDIMDLLYEKEETSILYCSPCSLAASILIVAYVITVPKQKCEFPILLWVNFITACKEEEILQMIKGILNHIFGILPRHKE
ncbi:cyclin-J18 [Malania oleifera]|uniref:cyclin-J18 n=1 Tax=Malania oleifera TaxID=397392 RepID=UPI0025AE9941|nr:cyclin-J18 [Malania oleifera]XP_057961639.1 cyclin-J18 [Malania oleifera]